MPYNPKSKANLKPIKKGQVLNPKGRGPRIVFKLEHILKEVMGGNSIDDSGAMKVIKNIFQQATDPRNVGAIRAAALLIERTYGTDPVVIQAAVDHTTKGKSMNQLDVKKLDTETLRKILEATKKDMEDEQKQDTQV